MGKYTTPWSKSTVSTSVDTGRKLNVHKTSPGRLMYVQFTFCVYVDIILDVTIITGKNVNGILLNNISFFLPYT